MKKAVIVGAVKGIDLSFFDTEKDVLFVCCDGGYPHFKKKGVIPDVFIGDLDSYDSGDQTSKEKTIILNKEKDDTDSFYAIKFLLNSGYNHFSLYGCLGGERLDMTIANLATLDYLAERGYKAFAYDEKGENVCFFLKNGSIEFKEDSKGGISVFAWNQKACGVTETGLKYTLDNQDLYPDVPLGVSNEFIGKKASVTVKEGTLLIMTDKENLQ